MCFDNKQRQKGVKIATKNIHVFKGLDVSNSILWNKPFLRSPYNQNTVWKVGEIKVVTRMSESTTSCPLRLHYGLHSAKTITETAYHACTVYHAIIPKGSLYWENDNEYVSNQLKITKLV